MSERLFLLGLVLSLGACTPGAATGLGGDGGGGAGSGSTGATGTTTGSMTTSSGNSTSTGTAGCTPTCTDGDPCTDDSCEGNTCKHDAKAFGMPGNITEGPCVGVCQPDGQCGLQLYVRPFPANGPWSEGMPLGSIWTGTNAPPPRGIIAAAHAYLDGRTFLWADDGKLYWHTNNAWQTPVDIAAAMPGVTAANLRAVEMWRPNQGGSHSVLVFTGDTTPRHALFFDLGATVNFTANASNPFTIGPVSDPQGGPQDTVDCDWAFAVQTAYLGTPDWVIFWRHFAGKVYEYNGGNDDWMANWEDGMSPVDAISTAGPAPGSIIATYYDSNSLYAIAP